MSELALQQVDVRIVSPYRIALDELAVDVLTPNEQVGGSLRYGRIVSIWIAHGYAERVGAGELAVQLGRVARLLVAARTARLRALQEEHLAPHPGPLRGPRLAMREELDAVAVTADSDDGSVRAATVGLGNWAVVVRRDAVDRLGAVGLSAAATQAAQRAVDMWLEQVELIKGRRRAERPR